MAPVLRSSAPSTPVVKADNKPSTPSSTPRKIPHCTQCKRPRRNHPRQGCPYADSPVASVKGQDQDTITGALDALHISRDAAAEAGTPTRPRRSLDKKSVVAPCETLASLSTDSSEVVNMLTQPGMMGDEVDDDDCRQSLARVQAVISTSITRKPAAEDDKCRVRAKMPGTLHTPFPSFYDSPQTVTIEDSSSKGNGTVVGNPIVTFSSVVQTIPASPRSLSRSMSMDERNQFLEDLAQVSESPPATVVEVPEKDLPAWKERAARLGYHSRELPDKKTGVALWIIGRNEGAVKDLYDKITKHVNGHGRAYALGGAVVGAAATWTGLAFS